MTLLLVDAGQTAIRMRLITRDGVRNWSGRPLRTSEDVDAQITREVITGLPSTGESITVAAAVSGLTNGQALADGLLGATVHSGVRTVVTTHDSISGYLGCIGEAGGAVTAVGTGVVTLGVGASGYARVDGWGNIMGDTGSGYWIGRAALEAAMRSYDGRGPKTALLDVLREDYPQIESAYMKLQQDADRVARVASYAEKTLQLAATDTVARTIAIRAAGELAASLSAALTRAGWSTTDAPTISWTGGIMSSAIVADELSRLISRRWVNATICTPQGQPIDGVAYLPDLPAAHPLSPLVARASVVPPLPRGGVPGGVQHATRMGDRE